MQRVSNGYTITEVMIFLAISSFIVSISFFFMKGTIDHNRFSQGMRDTQSKLQDWLNDITTGYATATRENSELRCREQGGAPAFHNDPSGVHNEGTCIFLGKAIQFTDKDTTILTGSEYQRKILAYSVFGLREIDPDGGGGPEDPRPVYNLEETAPTPLVGINAISGPANTDLTETYTIPGYIRVKSILSSSGVAANQSHLAGFYLSFNQLNSTKNGASSLTAYQYNLTGNQYPGNVPSPDYSVDKCISMTDPDVCERSHQPSPIPSVANWPNPLTNWQICFDNEYNNDTALITISSVSGINASVKLEFKAC